MYEKLEHAICYATKAHKGQTRKISNKPYIFHPFEVATIASSIFNNEDLMVAGILHDVIEDSKKDPQEIRDLFGDRVLELVLSETENKHPSEPGLDSWKTRKEESLAVLEKTNDLEVKALWISDKLSNLRSIYHGFCKEGPSVWNLFNQKDPQMHKWYYSKVLEYTKELSETSAYKDIQYLFDKLFSEEKK